MPSPTDDPAIERRRFLEGLAATGALVAGAGTASATHDGSRDVRVTVWLASDVPADHHEDFVVPALDEITAQTGVQTHVAGLEAADAAYAGSAADVVADCSEDLAGSFDGDAINLVVYRDEPSAAAADGPDRLAAPPVAHEGTYPPADGPAVAAVDAWAERVSAGHYLNTLIAAVLRPVLTPQLPRTPPSATTPSFGTIRRPQGVPKASPLATWHVPSDCLPFDLPTTSVGAPASLCEAEAEPVCGVTTELSRCTREAVLAQLSGDGTVPAAGDPDGDGRHEDFNRNGRIDFADVEAFFRRSHDDAVQEDVEAYDFNGNGRIDFDDVRSLFEEI